MTEEKKDILYGGSTSAGVSGPSGDVVHGGSTGSQPTPYFVQCAIASGNYVERAYCASAGINYGAYQRAIRKEEAEERREPKSGSGWLVPAVIGFFLGANIGK